MKRKLIEVSPPLEAIYKHVARENPLRHGHGLSEAVARTVCENSTVLRFDASEFELVEW